MEVLPDAMATHLSLNTVHLQKSTKKKTKSLTLSPFHLLNYIVARYL